MVTWTESPSLRGPASPDTLPCQRPATILKSVIGTGMAVGSGGLLAQAPSASAMHQSGNTARARALRRRAAPAGGAGNIDPWSAQPAGDGRAATSFTARKGRDGASRTSTRLERLPGRGA